MTHIGDFTCTADGYVGRLRLLMFDIELCFVQTEACDTENMPDYRIHRGATGEGPEVGAAWKRTGERAGPYVAVVLDDPTFAQPPRANLFHSGREDGLCLLLWSRPARRRATP